MATIIQQLQRALRRPARAEEPAITPAPAAPLSADALAELDLPASDPLHAYIQSAPGVIDLAELRLDSPLLSRMRAEGVRLAVPLLSQGELVGMLTLGPRRSEQEYASDDKGLLASLATQAAPALRVAQLVRQQRAEARERERIAQELRVARLIQQTLLPREVPQIAGWRISPYYEPAREVGGDFYDFIALPDGRLGLVIADVTDKGVPAALVMATTRSILRAAATRLDSPGAVLTRVNEMLCPDIPPKMFVTCFYAVLDPASGGLHFANAGHDLPYMRTIDGEVHELRARGMPLGLMPGMVYEEGKARLAPGEHLLLYTDGVVEAHDTRRAMFSFERLAALVAGAAEGGPALIAHLLAELRAFTGEGWVQEDDITLVTLERESAGDGAAEPATADGWRTLAELSVPSAPDNERLAMDQVATAVAGVGLAPRQLERLKTAVAEATMNAMEHGNQYRADRPTRISVRRRPGALSVRIYDHGAGPAAAAAAPDLEAKLAGLQTPRGWGLHLIQHMVDELLTAEEGGMHVIDLRVRLG